MDSFVFILLLVFTMLSTANAQSTNDRRFRADSDASDSVSDCAFRVRSNESATMERSAFRVRPRNHNLTVSAINSVTLTNADVDTAFEAASTLLQAAQNPPDDQNCCVSITRDGNVGNFAQQAGMVGGVITNNTELQAVGAIGDDVMVVNDINFCGGTGNFNGCEISGSIIFDNGVFTAGREATIAHELGHREGLCHTGGCPCGRCGTCTCAGSSAADTRTIMFCSSCTGVARDTISAAECSTYQSNAAK